MTEYTWTLATGADVTAIVSMAEQHFQNEIDAIFTPEPITMSRNVTLAVINQFYIPGSELVTVAYNSEGKLLAYTWAIQERTCWSDNLMVAAKMAHVDLSCSPRQRIALVKDMMQQWENFARSINVDIVCSTTMRRDQTAFLKLHTRNGYDVRGSFAYKKLSAEQTRLPIR
jgi:hypothetical protein